MESKILNSEQIKAIDNYTIVREPIKSIDLMERAANTCTNWIIEKFDKTKSFLFVCGNGNNGGDGLAIARQMSIIGYKNAEILVLKTSLRSSNDFSINLEQAKNNQLNFVEENNLDFERYDIIIDSLFGYGLNRPIDKSYENIISKINLSNAIKIAIDIPSGLFADSLNSIDDLIIRANETLTFQFFKKSFLYAENEDYIGNVTVMDIGLDEKSISETVTTSNLIQYNLVKTLIHKRKRFSHKGTYGYGLLIGGQYGMSGAAILSAKACMKSGIGLLTVDVPSKCIDIIQNAIPEAITIQNTGKYIIEELANIERYDAIAFGCGIGTNIETSKVLEMLMESNTKPLVIDADGINIISKHRHLLKHLNNTTILTPHLKEFERLVENSSNSEERISKAIDFCRTYNTNIVLKGVYTLVCNNKGLCWFNTTGNSGMATAGMGDVLTGMILSFLAQSYSIIDSAILAVYLHGLAGDIALENESKESLIASDLIASIGKAFKRFE